MLAIWGKALCFTYIIVVVDGDTMFAAGKGTVQNVMHASAKIMLSLFFGSTCFC